MFYLFKKIEMNFSGASDAQNFFKFDLSRSSKNVLDG